MARPATVTFRNSKGTILRVMSMPKAIDNRTSAAEVISPDKSSARLMVSRVEQEPRECYDDKDDHLGYGSQNNIIAIRQIRTFITIPFTDNPFTQINFYQGIDSEGRNAENHNFQQCIKSAEVHQNDIDDILPPAER